MKINTVINNGTAIPNECDCIWCGSKMERRGANYMGSGVNQFVLWCDNCGAVVIHAKDFERKIDSVTCTFEFKDEEQKEMK